MSDKSEKKSILSWINDALYEKVETGEDEPAPATREAGSGKPPAGAAAPPAAAPPENPADLAARLRQHIAAQGQAFTQFQGLVSSFTEIIPDEPGRYRAALKALEKTGNVTAEQVLLAGKDQLQALESQREVFADAVSRKRQALRQGGGRLEEVRARIAELQQSISVLQGEEQSLVRSAAAEESQINAAEKGFSSLLAELVAEITAAREKIKKYLGA